MVEENPLAKEGGKSEEVRYKNPKLVENGVPFSTLQENPHKLQDNKQIDKRRTSKEKGERTEGL